MKLKQAVMGAGAAALMFGSMVAPAFAAGTPNQQSCFGQARSAYATTAAPGAVGDAASARAGDNAAINAAFRAACQG